MDVRNVPGPVKAMVHLAQLKPDTTAQATEIASVEGIPKKFLDAILASPDVGAAMTRQSGFTSTVSGVDKVLNERERKASALPDAQMERVQFFSAINRALKNELVDRATAEIKAA